MRLSATALLVSLALVACGTDDREDAQQAVRDFVTATEAKDVNRLCGELVTQKFLEQATGAMGDRAQDACRKQFKALRGVELKLVKVGRTKVDDQKASVAATVETQGQRRPQVFRLEKEDGSWRLTGNSR